MVLELWGYLNRLLGVYMSRRKELTIKHDNNGRNRAKIGSNTIKPDKCRG
jgi:hypothetical protein